MHGLAEEVILLDESGRQSGSALKESVHSRNTPLHLAFSCYLLNHRGQVLLTRRALAKRTWPGVWTNSFCGHPLPGEPITGAVTRRADHELGINISDVRCVLPDFRYRATDASGIVENEVCPVFVAHLDSDLNPNADEVMDAAWVSPASLTAAVTATPFAFSPWLVDQLPALTELGALELERVT